MCIHCHQPVDNFGYIFEEAYKKSYEPFLDVLERHSGIKLSLHYSGSLLDWIAAERPYFLERVKDLVRSGRVEILTGGYFEPVLSMVPEKDAKGQIEMLTRSIEKRFNFKAKGLWLAERVWDPSLSPILRELGLKYTIVDDFHLRQAGKKNEEIFGHYALKGFLDFSVFASVKRLRYTMPFREPEVTLDFLKGLFEKGSAGSVTFADDCEKFGFWPYTYDWVYKKGWLEKFFTALEEDDWIRTLTFTEALEESPPRGEADIPHSSYAEMVGWCDGNFNNFFKKYPESNLMRNRMLCVSREIETAKAQNGTAKDANRPQKRKIEPQKREMLEEAEVELYKAQSNCAYWHGIFGGVYLDYLRQGVYGHIIKAANIINGSAEGERARTVSLENDRKKVISLRNKYMTLFLDPGYAGSLFELDYAPLSYNLINTMSRRYEPYHEKLKRPKKLDARALEEKVDRDEAIDLYEVLGVREPNLRRLLNYDSYNKVSFLCHTMDLRASLEDFVKSAHAHTGEGSLFGPYEHEARSEKGKLGVSLKRRCGLGDPRAKAGKAGESHPRPLVLEKTIFLGRDAEIAMRFDMENTSSANLQFLFGVEFNWSVHDNSFMRKMYKRRLGRLTLSDKYTAFKIEHVFKTPVSAWSFPVYTLNESERGLGKNFQEISILFFKKVALAANGKFSLEGTIRISG